MKKRKGENEKKKAPHNFICVMGKKIKILFVI